MAMTSVNLLILLVICNNNLHKVQTVSSEHAIHLNSGFDCPLVGLGLGGSRSGGHPEGDVVLQMMEDALEVGYRHFDTSHNYSNEQQIGEAIGKAIHNGLVKRSDVFITTKLELTQIGSRQNATNGINLALERLNTTYIDLLLIHRPSLNYSDAWAAMESAVNEGLVRSIGVSNFNETNLDDLLKIARIRPAMNQIESYPGSSHSTLISYCKKLNIAVTAYSPLGFGTQINNMVIVDIGSRHNKTSAQVMIRWQVQRGVAAIPKSTNRTRIEENFEVFDFSLTDAEMSVLENIKE